jgi:hypothetical protein
MRSIRTRLLSSVHLLLLLLLLLLAPSLSRAQSRDLKTLAHWMSGSYGSREQHLKDTANYFDIRLQIVPVWEGRKDGFWFYVEQAVSSSLDKPYRQRVYHLSERSDGSFESKVFTLQEPLRFTHHADLVEKLSPDSLIEREGCSVILRKKDKHSFSGGTEGKNCPSDRKGASYATSEVTLEKKLLKSWDRGYNDKDEQVWGADKGGYLFVKLKQY